MEDSLPGTGWQDGDHGEQLVADRITVYTARCAQMPLPGITVDTEQATDLPGGESRRGQAQGKPRRQTRLPREAKLS